MIGFAAGLALDHQPKRSRRPGWYASVLLNVGRSFKRRSLTAVLENPAAGRFPSVFVRLKLRLIFALINIVGVEFLINFGGLGQLINELAERYDLPGTYAAICFVILASIVFFDYRQAKSGDSSDAASEQPHPSPLAPALPSTSTAG